jgi:hypothetical protein
MLALASIRRDERPMRIRSGATRVKADQGALPPEERTKRRTRAKSAASGAALRPSGETNDQSRDGEEKMVVFGRFVEATRGLILKEGAVAAPSAPTGDSNASAQETRPERDAVQACRECQSACLEMVSYCVRMQGYYAELGHVRLLEDCARICEMTVDFVLRGSEMRGGLLAMCAEICQRCARDCTRFDYDQRLLACAAACERCADACLPLAV